MGCICKCHERYKKKYMQKEINNDKNFVDMRIEINGSLKNVFQTLNDTETWDDFFNPPEKMLLVDKKFKLNEINIDDAKFKHISYLKLLCSYNCEKILESHCANLIFFICGIFFCLVQLIGVQAGIIIINALSKEILDDIKLSARHIPRKYNFYENLEISTYKSIPDIDVGMTFCFLGTIFLKNNDYYLSFIFYLLNSIGFTLLFWLFEFHTGKELLNSYFQIELAALIFSYIILTILVGITSIIGLKEFMNIYKYFYKKHFNLSKLLCCSNLIQCIILKFKSCCQNKDKKEEEQTQATIIDQNMSKDKSSEKIIDEKENTIISESSENLYKKQKDKEDVEIFEKFFFLFFSALSCMGIMGINRAIFSSFINISTKNIFYPILIVYICSNVLSIILYSFYSLPKSINNIKKDIFDIVEITEESKNNYIKNEQLINNIAYSKINNKIDNNLENQCNKIKLEDIIEIEENNNPIDNQLNDKKQYFKKVCTCFGYVYFSKKVENRNICICHKNKTCCSWFTLKITKLEIFFPLLIEVYLQLSSVGFNSELSEKLLEEYSTSKIIKFYGPLFLLIFLYAFYVLFTKNIVSLRNNKSDSSNIDSKKCEWIIVFFFYLSFFLVISGVNIYYSIDYINKNNHSGKKFEDSIEGMVITIKCLDLHMLTFFDFFDDEDCLNTSLFITLEKLIWMIIEFMLDALEIKKNNLFIIQLSVSGLFLFVFFIIFYLFMIDFGNFLSKLRKGDI